MINREQGFAAAAGLLLSASIATAHAGSTDRIPAVVEEFHALALADQREADEWKRIVALFSFPVAVTEVAYELGEGWCRPRHQSRKVEDPKELADFVETVGEHWQTRSIKRLDEYTYGVIKEGDCAHETSVALDRSEEKIVAITLDAQQNLWGLQQQPSPR